MRAGWEIVKLDEVISFERGLTYAKGDEVAFSSVGVLRSNNVDLTTQSLNLDEIKYLREDFEVPSKKKVRKSSLLMCMSNGSKDHLGKVALIDRELDYAFGGFMGLLTPDEGKVFPKYLYYALASKSFKDYIHSLADGANINNLKYKDLAAFDILLPSLAEQQRIVDILDQEFAKIDALKANAEKSLQAAKDLFQATLKKELEPKEGWETSSLSSIGKTATGTTPSTSNKENYGSFIPFIKPADVNVDGKGALCYDNEGLSDIGASRGRVFPENSILMVCIGASIGKVGYSLRPVSSNQQINILSPGKEFYWKYIYYCMASGDFQQKVIKEGESAKATLPIINKSKWERLTISSPGITEQERIASRLDDLNNKCQALQDNYQKTLALCDDLKQSLLRKAFNGEL